LYNNYNTDDKILQDLKNGKEKPWREKKIKTLTLADSFKRLDYEKKSNRVRFCGSALAFLRNIETGEKCLKSANFCRERLCPMCQWRTSIKVFHQVSKVMDIAEKKYKNYVPIFLTLSVKNCKGEDLYSTLDVIFAGLRNLFTHRKFQRIAKGLFRALEVTYDGDEVISETRYKKYKKTYDNKGIHVGDKNLNYDTFHPHIHMVLLVDKSYFKGEDYMQTVEWVQMWRKAAKLDYDPVCDIRKVKTNKGKHKAVAEVAKYTLKDSEFLVNNNDITDRLVSILSKALRGRRLYAFGGVFKEIAKELDMAEPDKGDLVHIDDESVREDVATVLEIYRWNFGFANYIKE